MIVALPGTRIRTALKFRNLFRQIFIALILIYHCARSIKVFRHP